MATAGDTRPEPLVSASVDLNGMPGFMLDTERLMASELWALSSGDAFKAAVALWCRAWRQVPAAISCSTRINRAPLFASVRASSFIGRGLARGRGVDRKSTRLNSSHT